MCWKSAREVQAVRSGASQFNKPHVKLKNGKVNAFVRTDDKGAYTMSEYLILSNSVNGKKNQAKK